MLPAAALAACTAQSNLNANPNPADYNRACTANSDCVMLPFKRCAGSCQCRTGYAINRADEERATADAEKLPCGPPNPLVFCGPDDIDRDCAPVRDDNAQCLDGKCVDPGSCEVNACG